tara:strand:+ start:132 stop:401 length:270 start_codon:yes stop_codon:yes gene_type:complete
VWAKSAKVSSCTICPRPKPNTSKGLFKIFRTYIYNNKKRKQDMRNKKIIDKEMNSLYDNLVRKKIPTVDDAIYLSDGLYMLPDGDIIEK